jgi:drug/metabolite transporter (DMT)-like permease
MNRNTMLGLSAILLWSLTVALARSVSERIGPLTAGACVYLTAGVLMLGHSFLKERSFRTLRELPRNYVFGCGAMFLVNTVATFFALGLASNHHQVVEIGLLNYLWPTLTILLSLVILGQKAGFGLIPGTLLAFWGIVQVLSLDTSISWSSFSENIMSNPPAYGLGVVAAVSWAFYSNLTRRWAGSSPSGAVSLFVLSSGAAFLFFRLFRPENDEWGLRVVLELAVLVGVTLGAYVFWDIAMRKGNVVLVAAFSYLTPFFSTVVSCLYLGLLPSFRLWMGCLLIIAGSFVSWRSVEQAPECADMVPERKGVS